MLSPIYKIVCAVVFAAVSAGVTAATPEDFLRTFASEAQQTAPAFSGFSAERGAQFFTTRHSDWSCASCHTRNPLATGEHVRTGKKIAPLAPAANPERFSSVKKVDKWFRRNCNDVLDRACTPQEKGDLLTYLLSLKS
jgi:hypothetical protein